MSSPLHRVCKGPQGHNRLLPIHTGISNALPVDQLVLVDDILTSCLDEALQHQANNAAVPSLKLGGDVLCDRNLPCGLLATVGVTRIDHDALCQLRLS